MERLGLRRFLSLERERESEDEFESEADDSESESEEELEPDEVLSEPELDGLEDLSKIS